MSTAFQSRDFPMADIHAPASNMDYLHAPLEFENGFGFSPATSPARDSSKQDFGGYFSNAMNDGPLFFDQNDGDMFNHYPQPSPLQSFPPSNFSTVNAKVVHGQVTPPSDNSPVTPKRVVENEPSPVSLDEPAAATQPIRKKRGSQPSQSSPASTQNAPKRRKTSAPRKVSMSSMSGGEGEGEEKDEKRSKFLERNRVAASKCRQKKKEWTANLEQKARDLQSNKTQLSILVNSLREEVLYLKGEVLKHDSCNCTALRNYMSRSVSQISGESPANAKLQPGAGVSPQSDLDLDGMSFAGSPDLKSIGGSPITKVASPI